MTAVLAHRVHLQQVVLNLIVNASDALAATPPAECRIDLSTHISGDEVEITVRDSGSGLPEDIERIFQPFHSTKPDGFGMGLAICRTLITAHRGSLRAKPAPGGGALFTIALPITKSPPS